MDVTSAVAPAAAPLHHQSDAHRCGGSLPHPRHHPLPARDCSPGRRSPRRSSSGSDSSGSAGYRTARPRPDPDRRPGNLDPDRRPRHLGSDRPPSSPAALLASPRGSRPRRRSPPRHASPELISDLITSLDSPTLSSCPSPLSASGSFGVDYGAYACPVRDPVFDDDFAACPPVRTAKPSGALSLLAAWSPGPARHDSAPGLRSLVRGSGTNASRPSSRGSASQNDDAQSIGNLSIERPSAPAPDLQPCRSLDSWGRRHALAYVTSRERLHDSRLDPVRPLASPFALASPVQAPRPGPLEPGADAGAMEGPKPIPSRDSSLRTATSRRRRLAPRRSAYNGECP